MVGDWVGGVEGGKLGAADKRRFGLDGWCWVIAETMNILFSIVRDILNYFMWPCLLLIILIVNGFLPIKNLRERIGAPVAPAQ